MANEPTEHPDLHALGPDARRALAAAEAEARYLGYARIGTEHLLLGLLGDGRSDASWALSEAGAGLVVVRTRVLEAKPPTPPGQDPGETMELTARADRALRRSVRFSHRRRTGTVTPEDLLIAVLDVEGTAGQVLRSLGLDVDAVSAALGAPEPEAPARAATAVAPRCPSCDAQVADELTYRVVEARGEHGRRGATVFSCGGCGAVLGVAPG